MERALIVCKQNILFQSEIHQIMHVKYHFLVGSLYHYFSEITAKYAAVSVMGLRKGEAGSIN